MPSRPRPPRKRPSTPPSRNCSKETLKMAHVAEAQAGHGHAHEAHDHAPQAFIWKYIFSKDHKVIGVQYYVVAMAMAVIAGLLAMLIRLQIAWPTEAQN